MALVRFTLSGVTRELDAETVIGRLRDVVPEAVREHGVRIGGVVYPVKQAFERASGIPRTEFTSQIALRHLRSLGFEILSGTSAPRRPTPDARSLNFGPASDARAWPWEGSVQGVFADLLVRHGWS